MPYMYDALYNTVRRYEEDEEDAIDERGLLKDGKKVRVPMMMRDSATIDGDVQLISRQELQDFDKAQLSARWKGGLAEGDRVRIGDRDLVVSGRNPENGKVQLRDASTSADGRQEAYDAYDNDIQSRYLTTHDAKAGEACTTAGREKGTWRDRAGRLVCVPGKSAQEQEWDIAGPLSDEQRVKVMDEAYQNYDDQISNAWKR